MKGLGAALIVVLAISGCAGDQPTTAAVRERPAVPASPDANKAPAPTRSPTPEPEAPTAAPGRVNPELRTAVAQAQVLEESLELVEAGRLEDARSLLSGDAGFEWVPSSDAEWVDTYDELRTYPHRYLQLFDHDGPDSGDVDGWVDGVTGRLAAFREATGLRRIEG